MICQYKRGKNIDDAVMFLYWLNVQENHVFICETNRIVDIFITHHQLSVMKINALAHQLAPHRLML